MNRIIVCGAQGRMGKELLRLIADSEELCLAAAVDRAGGEGVLRAVSEFAGAADVLVDFSHHSSATEILDFCLQRRLPLVVATTGHDESEQAAIAEASAQIPVFRSANMSVGVALLARLVQQAAAIFRGCDVEIIEKHHNRKVDAPSGTALLLADAVKSERPEAVYVNGRGGIAPRESNEIGIHALRMGNVVGEHEVIFSTDTQTISLRHEAHDRSLFAEGALAAANFIITQGAGLYNMENLLGQ